MSSMYHKAPSELLGIVDDYTAYCFNEACAYIQIRIDNDETPVFHKTYRSFKDIYAEYSKGGA
jgi:hypothetical protein